MQDTGRKQNKLVKECIKGNDKAQKELYQAFAPKMMSVCYRYSKNKSDAEDIFQSGWLRIFENLHKLRKTELLEWWMRKIFVNEGLQLYNKSKRLIYTDENYKLEQDNKDDVRMIQSFQYDQITKLIQELPDKMRMVFNLYIIEGFSHKEIAEMMNVSEGTTKSNLHDARKALRKKIELLNIELTPKSQSI